MSKSPVCSDETTTAGSDAPARRVSRRDVLIAGGAGAVGSVLAAAPAASASPRWRGWPDARSRRVVDVAATIEVLTTTVTTVALSKLSLPAAAVDTVGAASREELDHFQVLTAEYGGRPFTETVWIPDSIYASPTALFSALVVGEQICVDLYLVATTIWAAAGRPDLARAGAELTGVEGVHRALARQALGLQPNDRAFMKYTQPDSADGPGHGMAGFSRPGGAIRAFEAAGFGFGRQGATPGAFYDFATVSRRTPDPSFVNTPTPQ